MPDMNQQIIEEFRANEGKVGGYFQNSTVLLLHTTGAKSGKKRVNPLVTIEDGDQLIIIASKGGAPTNPDWFYNLIANPEVGVEYGKEKFQAQAVVTQEPLRTELFEKMVAVNPGFAEYQRKTSRIIPVVTLSRHS